MASAISSSASAGVRALPRCAFTWLMKACSLPAFAFAFGADEMPAACWCIEFARPGLSLRAASIASLSCFAAVVHTDAPAALVVPAGHGVAKVLPVPRA